MTDSVSKTDSALAHTDPENRGVCGFCGGEEGGYAKKNSSGKWQAACWDCVKPEKVGSSQTKRKIVVAPNPD